MATRKAFKNLTRFFVSAISVSYVKWKWPPDKSKHFVPFQALVYSYIITKTANFWIILPPSDHKD